MTLSLVLATALVLALAEAVFPVPAPAAVPVPPRPAPPSPAELVVAATNRQRAANRLSGLQIDPNLMLAAAERARECERRFSHDRPDGSGTETVFRQFGVRWSVMSENIYTDSYRDFNPDRILVNWMNSPGHRANILDRSVTHMGAGVHKGKNGMTYAVQLFRR